MRMRVIVLMRMRMMVLIVMMMMEMMMMMMMEMIVMMMEMNILLTKTVVSCSITSGSREDSYLVKAMVIMIMMMQLV
jgi:hypothetical protein